MKNDVIYMDNDIIIFTTCDKKGNITGEVIIDKVDLDKVKLYSWYINNQTGYVVSSSLGAYAKKIYLHRYILRARGPQVDHIDNNKLNNRKVNLRQVDHNKNFQNQKKRKTYAGIPCKSIYKGVTKTRYNKWRVAICVYGKIIRLGNYETETEAACVYDRAAKKYFGEYANLNFKGE